MTDPDDRAAADTTVAGVARGLWGVEPAPAIPRYAEPGWQLSPHPIDRQCPTCAGRLHGLYRVAGDIGKPRLQAAVVCPRCPASFKLSDLALSQRAVLGELRPEVVARRLADDERLSRLAAEQRTRPAPAPPTRVRQAVVEDTSPTAVVDTGKVVRAAAVAPQQPEAEAPERSSAAPPASPARRTSTTVTAAKIRRILADAGHTAGRDSTQPVVQLAPAEAAVEHRLLYWCKTVDPQLVVPPLPEGTDTRVVFPDAAEFEGLRSRLCAAGIAFRAVPHWVEEEWITSVDLANGELAGLQVTPSLSGMAGLVAEPTKPLIEADARAARDAFALLWDLHEPVDLTAMPQPVPAEELVCRGTGCGFCRTRR